MSKMTIRSRFIVTFSPSPSRHFKRVQDQHLHQMVASRITLLAIVIKQNVTQNLPKILSCVINSFERIMKFVQDPHNKFI